MFPSVHVVQTSQSFGKDTLLQGYEYPRGKYSRASLPAVKYGFKLILTMFLLWCFREHRYRRATKNMAIQHFATAQLWSTESRLIIQLWNVAHELKPTHTTPVPSISIRVFSISELNNSFSTSESIQYRRVHKYQNFFNVNWPRIHNFEYQIKYLIMIWRCIY